MEINLVVVIFDVNNDVSDLGLVVDNKHIIMNKNEWLEKRKHMHPHSIKELVVKTT